MKKNQFPISQNTITLLAILGLSGLFFYVISPFLLPVIMGAVLSLALSPMLHFFEKKHNFSRSKSLKILLLSSVFLFLGPAMAFIIRGSSLMIKAFNNPEFKVGIQSLQQKIIDLFTKLAPQFGLSDADVQFFFSSNLQKITGFILDLFSQILGQIPILALFSIILLVSIYFFLSHEDMFRNAFDKIFKLPEESSNRFIQILKTSCREVFLSNVLTGIFQACLVTLGAMIFGIDELFLILFITFICSFVPVIGAGPVAFLISAYLFSTDRQGGALGMAIVSVIAGTADNIIRPYLASLGEVKVPAVVNFIAVLGGVVTMGLPGLFLGPLIANLFYGILPILLNPEN